MILLQEKTDWKSIQGNLSDVGGFLDKLKNYDTSKYPESVFVKLRNTYLNRPEYDVKDIFKRSQAASFMATWVIAVNKYQKVLKVVEPKERKYNEVKAILDKAEAELAEKNREV